MTASLDAKVKEEALKGIRLGRFGQPADIAGAALFLAGDTGAYITAQVLVVDGGMTA
jgi:3-oxoacyl-[acyl-carrier protein] reductase